MIVQTRFQIPNQQSICICISILKDALHMGALPPDPHAFGATGFFRFHVIINPPSPQGLKLSPRCATSSQALNPQALLEQGSSPVKRSSSGAQAPQALLKPSSRRVKESLKKCSPK